MGLPCGPISGTKNSPKMCRKTGPGSSKIRCSWLGKNSNRGGDWAGGGGGEGGRVGGVCVGGGGNMPARAGGLGPCFARSLYHDRGVLQKPLGLQVAGSS